MFEGFCPSFANQYIGFNLPISLLCVDVNLGIFLPLPPQHSRLWKKEGVSLPLWWLCISNISLFGQLFSYSKDSQVFVIDLIRSFKQTANIILECFFSIIVCIVLLVSPSTNLENPFRKTIFANLLFCSQGAVIQPMLRLLVIHSSGHHLRWPIIGHQCFEGVPSSVKYLVNDNCATFNSLLLIKFILLILWKYFVFLCFGYLEYLCFVFYWNRDTSSCCQSVLSVGSTSRRRNYVRERMRVTQTAGLSPPVSFHVCNSRRTLESSLMTSILQDFLIKLFDQQQGRLLQRGQWPPTASSLPEFDLFSPFCNLQTDGLILQAVICNEGWSCPRLHRLDLSPPRLAYFKP